MKKHIKPKFLKMASDGLFFCYLTFLKIIKNIQNIGFNQIVHIFVPIPTKQKEKKEKQNRKKKIWLTAKKIKFKLCYNCFKLVQSFTIHCLFTGQFNTEDYGTFTDII